MKENLILLLGVAGAVALAIATVDARSEKAAHGEVSLLEFPASDFEWLRIFSATQTASLGLREIEGARWPWWEVESGPLHRSFLGNEEVYALIRELARLRAMRFLGEEFPPEILRRMGIEPPRRRMWIYFGQGSAGFVIGNRIGSDLHFFVRPEGSNAVYLVHSELLSALETPDGRYFFDQLRRGSLEDVTKVVLSREGRSLSAIHVDRQERKGAYWVREGAPQVKAPRLDELLHGLERIHPREHSPDRELLKSASIFLEVEWLDFHGASLGQFKLFTVEEPSGRKYGCEAAGVPLPMILDPTESARIEQQAREVFAE